MKRLQALLACLIFSSVAINAESKNPADYPIRVHIFSRSETNYSHNRYLEEAKGEGRANIFANGDVHATNFSFDCPDKVKDSFGYETYPAKWKKPGLELTVLLPVFGKSNTYFTCNFKTDVKDFVYVRRNGGLTSEAPTDYKTWMAKHDYDPEHGKNQPVKLGPTPEEP